MFHFHGQLSSRLEALYLQRAACQQAVCLVAIDRQGFGNSPPDPRFGLAEWPSAVRSIANQLGIQRLGLIGVSAGAKYALATALAVPELIESVALASSFGQLELPDSIATAAPRVKFAVALYRHAPPLGDASSAVAGFLMRNGIEPILRLGRHVAPPSERRILANEEILQIAAEILRSAARQGSSGIMQEFRAIVQPWNLPLDQIRVPVTVWHGVEDAVAPIAMAEALAASIPGARLHRVPAAGHVSLLVNHAPEILETA